VGRLYDMYYKSSTAFFGVDFTATFNRIHLNRPIDEPVTLRAPGASLSYQMGRNEAKECWSHDLGKARISVFANRRDN
jgi:hypothetical protein